MYNETTQEPLLLMRLVFVFERTTEKPSTGTETRRVDELESLALTLPEYFAFTEIAEDATSVILADPVRLLLKDEVFKRTIEQEPSLLILRRFEGRSDSVHDPVKPPAVD
jgi:hypothetical protein